MFITILRTPWVRGSLAAAKVLYRMYMGIGIWLTHAAGSKAVYIPALDEQTSVFESDLGGNRKCAESCAVVRKLNPAHTCRGSAEGGGISPPLLGSGAKPQSSGEIAY